MSGPKASIHAVLCNFNLHKTLQPIHLYKQILHQITDDWNMNFWTVTKTVQTPHMLSSLPTIGFLRRLLPSHRSCRINPSWISTNWLVVQLKHPKMAHKKYMHCKVDTATQIIPNWQWNHVTVDINVNNLEMVTIIPLPVAVKELCPQTSISPLSISTNPDVAVGWVDWVLCVCVFFIGRWFRVCLLMLVFWGSCVLN